MTSRRSFGRLRKLPSGRYQAAYLGPDDRLHVADSTFGARVDAEAWLTDRRREIDRELWSPPATGQQKTAKRAATVRFDDYAARWLATRTVRGRPLKPRTVAHYQAMLDDHLIPAFGKKAVRDISIDAVDRWYAKTLADKPTMRAHAYSLLRTIMETARTRDRLIDANPCVIRGGGTTTRKIKPKPATVDELDILTSKMPKQYQAMVPLAGWCAVRFGELVELRRSDCEFTERVEREKDGTEVPIREGVLKIRRAAVRVGSGWIIGDPKSDAGVRDVAIPPHILPVLDRHLTEHVAKEPGALLFPAKSGGHLQPSTLYRHFYRARDAAKRPDLRWHDLRHSGAVLAAQTGATLAELMSRLGHSTPQAAMTYQHAAAGRDRQIADAMSKMIEY